MSYISGQRLNSSVKIKSSDYQGGLRDLDKTGSKIYYTSTIWRPFQTEEDKEGGMAKKTPNLKRL